MHYTQPSQCAAELLAGRADLGLIPIAALTPELAVVPGCTIASLNEVRSIQLIVKSPNTFSTVKTVSADTASRSSFRLRRDPLPQVRQQPSGLPARFSRSHCDAATG
ncbi:MqnA/MqnD/SBP family protein [Tunturiibacter empetritectus]